MPSGRALSSKPYQRLTAFFFFRPLNAVAAAPVQLLNDAARFALAQRIRRSLRASESAKALEGSRPASLPWQAAYSQASANSDRPACLTPTRLPRTRALVRSICWSLSRTWRHSAAVDIHVNDERYATLLRRKGNRLADECIPHATSFFWQISRPQIVVSAPGLFGVRLDFPERIYWPRRHEPRGDSRRGVPVRARQTLPYPRCRAGSAEEATARAAASVRINDDVRMIMRVTKLDHRPLPPAKSNRVQIVRWIWFIALARAPRWASGSENNEADPTRSLHR